MIQEPRPLIPPCWHCQQANGNCNRLADSLLFARLSHPLVIRGEALMAQTMPPLDCLGCAFAWFLAPAPAAPWR